MFPVSQLTFVACFLAISGGLKQRRKSNSNVKLLEEWANSMIPELDYNGTYQWKRAFRSKSASDFFERYTHRFSKLALAKGATVNFASIGACDGMTDPIIKNHFLRNDHWNGVFVEPVDNNVVDLVAYLTSHGARNRSVIIQAAATSMCESSFIEVERPLYEEKNKSTPHWLRRQIGSILPEHRTNARAGWTKEKVRCVTPSDILEDWAAASPAISSKGKKVKGNKHGKKRRRPHVLKIDVEGHDYLVLMGFLLDATPVTELPLLIEFEAKSISKKFPEVKERLESIGYIVADYGQDGFALLRGDHVYVRKSNMNRHLKGLTVGDVIELQRRQKEKETEGKGPMEGEGERENSVSDGASVPALLSP